MNRAALLAASMSLFAIACGAPAPAPPDAAPSSDVSLIAYTTAGQPLPGAIVLFHDHDGALIARVATDHDGLAHAALPGGGSVTALPPPGATPGGVARWQLSTFVEVVP